MNKFGLSLLSLTLATTAQADRLNEQCQALFDEITADIPVDVAQCTPALSQLRSGRMYPASQF